MGDFDSTRLGRIESKLDELTEAMALLVRMEERQVHQRQEMVRLEKQLQEVDAKAKHAEKLAMQAEAKVTVWINRGLGLWGGAMLLWAVINSRIFERLQ